MSSNKTILPYEKIARAALDVGFSVCGVSRAEAVEESVAEAFRHWIAHGKHATMGYLAENVEKRLDPRLLHEGVKTIVSVALSYAPADDCAALCGRTDCDGASDSEHTIASESDGEYTIAAYALGKDYHDIMKTKLHQMAAAIGAEDYRAFCDTAPVLERYWAARAGIGFIGRNRQLIVPGRGSMFFLGELFLKEEVVRNDCETDGNDVEKASEASLYEVAMMAPGGRCGSCRVCYDACPTGALSIDGGFDGRLCLSYHTIENRGEIPPEIASKMGRCFYGCDRCLNACPHNHQTTPTDCADLRPSAELLAMTRDDWQALSIEDYRRLFKGSAVKRAKYEGLMRNIGLVSDIQ